MDETNLTSIGLAAAIAVLWVIGWAWRIRGGLLDGASRGQVAAMVVLMASVPIAALILAISL